MDDWQDAAACIGMDPTMFHPATKGARPHRDAAKACARCLVRTECADYALWNEALGYWGGMTATQRHDLRLRLRIPEPAYDRHYTINYALREGADR